MTMMHLSRSQVQELSVEGDGPVITVVAETIEIAGYIPRPRGSFVHRASRDRCFVEGADPFERRNGGTELEGGAFLERFRTMC